MMVQQRKLSLFIMASAAAVAGPLLGVAAFVTPATSRTSPINNIDIATLHSKSGGGETDVGGNDDFNINSEQQNFYNDFEDVELSSAQSQSSPAAASSSLNKPPPASSSSAIDDPSFFESLLKRQEQLQQSYRDLLQQWTTGSAKTFAAFTINEQFYKQEEELPFDWVRRVSIGSYPKVVCGSAYGSIYVADVESKQVLGVARHVHFSHHNHNSDSTTSVDGLDEKLRQYLYGDYDGGGVLAVAMMQGTNNLVASAGREGGVKLFKLVQNTDDEGENENELKFVGDVPSLKRPLPGVTPILVTCLEFDSLGRLFMGGQDGFLRMVTFTASSNYDDVMQVTLISSSHLNEQLKQQPPSPILSLDVSEELDMVATAHANGNVCMYSISSPSDHGDERDTDNDDSDSQLLGVWNPFSDTNNACHARSVTFVSGGNEKTNDDPSWSIVVGGGNGIIWMHEIHPSYTTSLSFIVASNDTDSSDDSSGVHDTTTPSAATMPRQPLFKENSMQQIKPSHQGPVLSMASRPGGVLVSVGHDGMLRVTQIHPTPKALYGLGGYKVWIGNICIDSEGKRLLSDGRDDVVVVHDFSEEEEEELLS